MAAEETGTPPLHELLTSLTSVAQHAPIPAARGVVFASYALLARPGRLAQVRACASELRGCVRPSMRSCLRVCVYMSVHPTSIRPWQVLAWCTARAPFQGVLALDECHRAKAAGVAALRLEPSATNRAVLMRVLSSRPTAGHRRRARARPCCSCRAAYRSRAWCAVTEAHTANPLPLLLPLLTVGCATAGHRCTRRPPLPLNYTICSTASDCAPPRTSFVSHASPAISQIPLPPRAVGGRHALRVFRCLQGGDAGPPARVGHSFRPSIHP